MVGYRNEEACDFDYEAVGESRCYLYSSRRVIISRFRCRLQAEKHIAHSTSKHEDGSCVEWSVEGVSMAVETTKREGEGLKMPLTTRLRAA